MFTASAHPKHFCCGDSVETEVDCGGFITLKLGSLIPPINQGKVHLLLANEVKVKLVQFTMEHGDDGIITGNNSTVKKKKKIKLSTLVNSNTNEKRPVGEVCITLCKNKIEKVVTIRVERSTITRGTVLTEFKFDHDGPWFTFARNGKVNNKRKNNSDFPEFESVRKKVNNYCENEVVTLGAKDVCNGASECCENATIYGTSEAPLYPKEKPDSPSDVFVDIYHFYNWPVIN